MIVLKERIILVLIAQCVSTLGSYDNIDLLNVGQQLNHTNCSGSSSPDDTRSLESGLRNTVCTVFNNLDEIFKHFLDFPMFYSVPKPHFQNIYKSLEDNANGSHFGTEGLSKKRGESEAYDNILSSTELEGCACASSGCYCEHEDLFKEVKAPSERSLDKILRDTLQVGPVKKEARSKRTIGADELKLMDYPYLVLISNKEDKTFRQTGVALSDNIILTAASGLSDSQGRNYEPKELNIYTRTPNGSEEFSVANIYRSPSIEVHTGEVTLNDIALLEVFGQSNISSFYPSLSNDSSLATPKNCSVLAWTKPDEFFANPSSMLPHVKEINVILSDKEKCKGMIPKFDETRSYCSNIREELHGNLGAPLICSGELFGFVDVERKVEGLDLYTRISQYAKFIEDNKLKSYQRFANQSWRSREFFNVESGADNLRRPYVNQLVTSPVFLFIAVVFHSLF